MPELDPTKRRLTWMVGRAANGLQPRSRRAPLAISQSQYEFSQITQFFPRNQIEPQIFGKYTEQRRLNPEKLGTNEFFGEKGCCLGKSVWLWLMAIGARRPQG